ncbi:hypothetical protein KBI33_03060 [Candidatus Shapirobacteria bacterium]|nr:hypothetical protein [Candidatus Shapirobacteria bacterium]
MTTKIYLVTGNPLKVKIAKSSLAPFNIEVEQLELETPEIQSFDTEEVAKYSVKYAAEKTGKAVIKGDFGMHIEILGGFPGPFVKFINRWLTAEKFISLYQNETNRKAYFIDALGYCEPEKEPVCFVTKTYGNLISAPLGNNGNMVDSLFIPDGFRKTIASLSEEETVKLWSNDRYTQLARYLKKLENKID